MTTIVEQAYDSFPQRGKEVSPDVTGRRARRVRDHRLDDELRWLKPPMHRGQADRR